MTDTFTGPTTFDGESLIDKMAYAYADIVADFVVDDDNSIYISERHSGYFQFTVDLEWTKLALEALCQLQGKRYTMNHHDLQQALDVHGAIIVFYPEGQRAIEWFDTEEDQQTQWEDAAAYAVSERRMMARNDLEYRIRSEAPDLIGDFCDLMDLYNA